MSLLLNGRTRDHKGLQAYTLSSSSPLSLVRHYHQELLGLRRRHNRSFATRAAVVVRYPPSNTFTMEVMRAW